MKITNKIGLPDAIVRAIQNDPYDRGESDLTVSELISPPRQRVLMKMHDDKLEEDASDRIWALMGQVIHGILERAETTGRVEERMYMDVDGIRIGGQYDRMLLSDSLMQDYKLTSVWRIIFGDYDEWETQINLLRLIAHHNGYHVDQLEVVALLRDWVKTKARHESNYPSSQVVVVPMPVWKTEETEREIRKLVTRHLNAERELPECTDDERWQRSTVYAVKKPRAKRAVSGGLHESMEAAQLHANAIGGAVEVRLGEPVRCAEGYCPVAEFCSQYQGEIS